MALASDPRASTLLADAALAVPLGAIMVVGTHFATMNEPGEAADALAFGLVALAIVALPARRLLPRVALAGTTAAAAAYVALGYAGGPIYLAWLVTQYTIGAHRPVRASLPAYAGSAAVLVATELAFSRAGWVSELGQAAAFIVVGLAPWAVGTIVRMRRESAAAAREEQRRDRAYQERLRTAQDVHDIIGHGLAAISMQAGVGLHVLDRSPEQAREVLKSIKASSQDALDELRSTLAVFRSTDGQREPAPGLDRLDTLVSRTTEAGVPAELVRAGALRRLPASVELTAYRIVQEALTNVLRHAGTASATVRLEQADEELTVQISDTGRGDDAGVGAGDGQGIAGMRARAGTVGGTLEAGPRPGGGFTVRARLPVHES